MKTQTLKRKLIGPQLCLTAFILLVSWVLISVNDYFILKATSLEKFETAVKILSRNLGPCLAVNDKAECTGVLDTLNLVEGVHGIVVMDEKGEVFTSSLKSTKDSHRNFKPEGIGYEYLIKDRELISSYPILEKGRLKGRLFLVSEFDLFKSFTEKYAFSFLLIVLGSLLLALIFYKALHAKITGQLLLMLNILQRIGLNKNYSLRIQDDPEWKKVEIHEFRQMGESFDSMLEQVELRDFSMKKHNEDLEKVIQVKVQEVLRSAELASLGEMAGGIAHEINNPLTIIKSSNRVLLKMVDKENFDKASFKEFLLNVDQTVDRIAKIVTGLRNISRKAEDKDIAPCTYDDVFGDVFDVAEAKFKSRGIELKKSYSPSESATRFPANRIQLCQVLVNLLNNSFDAITDLEDQEKWIEIKIKLEKDKIALHLIDSGKGISAKVREKMFNPFFTTKEIGKGTGIGLAISKSMVEKMGGECTYDEKNHNTAFVVTLRR
jgi:signal transduction histidine kinase